ncbi:translation initiation factor IF-2 [Hydrogenimonas cancrithermarum]|uniref:Translation initiation factor IF-2 n=1 Tax=Hydrogenimonas cancrithermarum TaxID=2993563 RepID=A0ABN6WTY1_9BACT|nr:translation initiation factor IF-2 [Hydrogenimonas cancrithermarum]BDY12546.1 translation initiation factor IF-2 [Hydrogenimonas cancrithermarum]
MGKVRIHEIADELGIKSKEVVEKAREMGLDVKTASSGVSPEDAQNIVNYVMTGTLPASAAPKKSPAPEKEKEAVEQAVEKPTAEKVSKTEPEKAEEAKAEAPKEKRAVEKEEKQPETKVAAEKMPEEKAEEKAEPETETKPEPKPEERPVKESEKKETLGQASVKRRRGIFIVKKKRPKVEPVTETPTIKKSEIGKENRVIAAVDESIAAKRAKKKAKKAAPAPGSKESGVKLSLLEDRDIGGISVDYATEEVVLPDFSEELRSMEEPKSPTTLKPEQPRPKQPIGRRGPQSRGKRSVSRTTPKKRQRRMEKTEATPTVVKIPEDCRVYEFAEKVGHSTGEVIKILFGLGKMVTKNDFLEKDEIEILADEFGVEVETINPLDELDYVAAYDAIPDEYLEERPPVITIMGHVDHGKTSLLDKIRETKVAEREAGGITQHVGAYQVEKDGKKITFIDTPGHEAFTEMRARGAQATDIVIIVVAADDGVKPQTIEALNHAKAAEVPMVIAINKIDKPDANPDMVKSQLAELGYMPVDWGGEYEFVEVSAKTGQGIDDLLETILLQAEIMELKANPKRNAKAVVIESSLEKGRGPVATVIVKNGTLHVGDHVICGRTFGRVRTILNDLGKQIKELGPSDPGVVVGLNEVPDAGEIMVAMDSDKQVRELAQKRAEYLRQKELSKSTKVTLDELGNLIAEGKIKSLPVIVKADVQGSLEAIKGSLEKLKNEEVKINIIHSGVGGITESDVALANADENAVILGFNVRPTAAIKQKAKQLGVEIKTYSIIYDLIDDVKALLSGLMSPVISEEGIGQAEVRETFSVAKVGTIAGCIVTDGVIKRNAKARLIRDGVVIYDTRISSLKRFKEDAKEVGKGYECGLMLENFNDIKVGDVIEAYEEKEEKATL